MIICERRYLCHCTVAGRYSQSKGSDNRHKHAAYSDLAQSSCSVGVFLYPLHFFFIL